MQLRLFLPICTSLKIHAGTVSILMYYRKNYNLAKCLLKRSIFISWKRSFLAKLLTNLKHLYDIFLGILTKFIHTAHGCLAEFASELGNLPVTAREMPASAHIIADPLKLITNDYGSNPCAGNSRAVRNVTLRTSVIRRVDPRLCSDACLTRAVWKRP